MAEINKRNNGEQKEGGSKKKDNLTVVLKADFHCEGCASKVIKCIRSFDGVDTVTIGDGQNITVVGNVDPAKLRQKVEQKTHKKVEVISPQPKKDGSGGGGDNKEKHKGKENGGGDSNNGKNEKSDQKKEKEIPVTTAVFKANLHCFGCVQKIYKTITKTKGYEEMKIDEQKELVTVTGAIDMKALAEVLSKQLKKDVEIVTPPKTDSGKKENGGGEKGKNGGDEGNKTMQQQQAPPLGGYPYPFMPVPVVMGDQLHYNPYPVYQYQAPQIFSDENPNACRVM